MSTLRKTINNIDERPITLGEYIIKQEKYSSRVKSELSFLISSIKLAGKMVNQSINRAGLSNILGKTKEKNIQGEIQGKLDLLANEVFINTLKNRGVVCGLASEEIEEFLNFDEELNSDAKYVVLIDPLDGSSNIDVNVTVGTIFSIYERITPLGTPVTIDDFLQPGNMQIAAGYLIYGSSTILVYTAGNGVNGFTYDPGIGSFFLSHKNIKFPIFGGTYSLNEGNYEDFPLGIKKFIKWAQKVDPNEHTPLTARYTGSLVSDFHRNMLIGGIYLYPQGSLHPNGKLRLLYEANPIAYLAEQAGGKAVDGSKRIMDIKPKMLHQRTPFICGSISLVDKAMKFMKTY